MALKKTILISLMACIFSCSTYSQTKVIAHRGYWDQPASTQNSIVALYKAAQIDVYGSEFDVLVTADGVPVVNHDDKIYGYTIEKTEFATLRDLKLSNGETLPTLEQYLVHGKANSIKLILEIKPHSTKEIEDKAVEIIMKMVDSIGVAEQTEYISFSLNICKEIVKRNTKTTVAYLDGKVDPAGIKEAGLTGIDYHYSVIERNVNWVKQCHDLGLTVNVWTVNDPEIMKRMIDHKVDFITTDKPELLQSILK